MLYIKISNTENEITVNEVNYEFDFDFKQKSKTGLEFLTKEQNCEKCKFPTEHRDKCKFIPCGNPGAVKRTDNKRGYFFQYPV